MCAVCAVATIWATLYQEVNLCPNLTVAENVFAGRYSRKARRSIASDRRLAVRLLPLAAGIRVEPEAQAMTERDDRPRPEARPPDDSG